MNVCEGVNFVSGVMSLRPAKNPDGKRSGFMGNSPKQAALAWKAATRKCSSQKSIAKSLGGSECCGFGQERNETPPCLTETQIQAQLSDARNGFWNFLPLAVRSVD